MKELDPAGSISGPDYPIACKQSLYTLTLSSPLPQYSTITWSKTGDFQLTLVTNNIVMVKPNYAGATGKITATTNNLFGDCVKRDISFDIKGTTDATYALNFGGLPNCNWQAVVTPSAPGDTYRWSSNFALNYFTNSPNFYPPHSSGFIPGSSDQVWVRIGPGVCQSSVSPYLYLTKVFNKITSGCDPDPDDPNNSPFRLAPPIESNRVEAFPNPSTSDWRLIITSRKAQNIEATLKDAAGKTLWSKRTTEGISGIPVIPGEGLSAGVYFLYLRIEGTAHQLKLVKQ